MSELLSDQPRIAPLWDDLSPNNGGTVTVEYGAGSATVSFVDVPEFFSTGANNFAVTLNDDGSYSIAYGGVTAADGLVGSTEGGGATDPGSTDLSAAGGSYAKAGTTYEQFSFGRRTIWRGAVLSSISRTCSRMRLRGGLGRPFLGLLGAHGACKQRLRWWATDGVFSQASCES